MENLWIAFGLNPTSDETLEARTELESIGVVLGAHDGCGSFDDCIVSDEAFEKLDPLWGKYIWG